MNLTPLKYLLFVENLTSVFRNYLCLKRRTRIIVLVWVFINAFNLSITAVANVAPGDKYQVHYNQQGYFCLSTSFSFYLLIASLFYSKIFYRLLLNFDAFYKCFDDGVYYRKILKAQKVSTYGVSVFCFIIFVLTYIRWNSSAGSMGWVATIITLSCTSMSDIRYILQYFLMHCIMFVVSEQVKAITRSIDSELSAMKENRQDVEHTDESSVVVKNDKFNEWLKAYDNINDSSNLCHSMFSVQLTLMHLMVTAYYIILMYTVITTIISVECSPVWLCVSTNLFAMVVFLSAQLVIYRAGQRIQNSYVQLHQKLCKLYLQTLEHKEYYKLTKDLLRYVRTRPVRVHVFGTLDVNMPMLPSVIAFFTTYTVIVLQFNNVV